MLLYDDDDDDISLSTNFDCNSFHDHIHLCNLEFIYIPHSRDPRGSILFLFRPSVYTLCFGCAAEVFLALSVRGMLANQDIVIIGPRVTLVPYRYALSTVQLCLHLIRPRPDHVAVRAIPIAISLVTHVLLGQ
jgi:hypothetical protein